MTSFAENFISYPDGQQNVNAPPESTLLNGFVPATAANRGQPLPAQWLNWLFQKLFRAINRDVVTNSAGVGLFKTANSCIRLEAFDREDSDKFLVAIGWKGSLSNVHTLKVIQSTSLTLGVPTASGNQPILGGANVIVVGYSRQIGDL
jgi:hypothetical protein